MKRITIQSIDPDVLRIYVEQSKSKKEVLEKIGVTARGAHHKILQDRLNALNINMSHFNKGRITTRHTYTDDEIFTVNSIVSKRVVKRQLMKLRQYKCELCPLTDSWNNKLLVLQLDHKNGEHTDNRLTNLRFLCPNCHSQTDTFGSKNLSS